MIENISYINPPLGNKKIRIRKFIIYVYSKKINSSLIVNLYYMFIHIFTFYNTQVSMLLIIIVSINLRITIFVKKKQEKSIMIKKHL